MGTMPVADLGGAQGRPKVPTFFDFMQFSEKKGQIVCWPPPRGSWCPPWGNPGSPTECSYFLVAIEVGHNVFSPDHKFPMVDD